MLHWGHELVQPAQKSWSFLDHFWIISRSFLKVINMNIRFCNEWQAPWFFSFLFNFIAILFTFWWPIEKCVCIFVDKIDDQLKILWLSTFIDKLNLSIDNYQQISSSIDLSTTFPMIDFDWHVTSWHDGSASSNYAQYMPSNVQWYLICQRYHKIKLGYFSF